MATPPTRSGGERKADIQARLTEAAVPWTAAMTVAGLRQREAAAAYDTSKMSREDVKALTIATLREILAIAGGGGGCATLPAKPKHTDYVDAVFALNAAAYAEEAEKVASVPLDVFRIVTGYLPTHAAKMRLAVAVGDREGIAEIAKSAHPTELTVIRKDGSVVKHANLGRETLMTHIADATRMNWGWQIEDAKFGNTKLTYRPGESDYVLSNENLPGFFLKVNQNPRVEAYIFLYYVTSHRFSVKGTTQKAFAEALGRLTIGMEWIWRYTEDGLKPNVFGAKFSYKPWNENIELADTWSRWVQRQIRIYKRRKA